MGLPHFAGETAPFNYSNPSETIKITPIRLDGVIDEVTQERFAAFPLCGNQGVDTVEPVSSECSPDIHI